MRVFYFNELFVWWIGLFPAPSSKFLVTQTNENRTLRIEGIHISPNSHSSQMEKEAQGNGGPGLPSQQHRKYTITLSSYLI